MSKKTSDHLLELEHKYWTAIKERDADAAMALCDESCIVTGAQGVGKLSREELGAMMPQATYELRDFRIEDGSVSMLTDEIGVVAYKVHEDLIVDGKPVSFDAAESSTWVKRGGRWRCAVHTESILGDPFGRDRTQGAPTEALPHGMA